MKLLLVEDNRAFAQVVGVEFLSSHHVSVASDLATARDLLAEDFDAALVDYDLPDGKGDSLVGELREAGLVVIGISSHGRGNAAILAAGAHASCSKMEFERIGDVLATHVGHAGDTSS